jgi:hypothetical protein
MSLKGESAGNSNGVSKIFKTTEFLKEYEYF